MIAALALACRPPPRHAVDFHVHLGPGEVARADAVFQSSDIEVAVHLSGIPFGPELQAALAEAAAAKTRVVVFSGVDWRGVDAPDFGEIAADELRRAVAAGAAGLKISKALGLRVRTADGKLLPVDSPRLDPLWRAAGELGVPVAIHTGDPLAFFLPPTPDNERYAELRAHPQWGLYGTDAPPLRELLAARDRLVARHPRTQFVAVHVGGLAEDLDAVARSMRASPNLWIDVAARLPEIGRRDPARVRAFFVEFQDRVLLGTDLQLGARGWLLGSGGGPQDPRASDDDARAFYRQHWRYFESDDRGFDHLTPIQGTWTLDAIALPADVRRKLYRDNALRLLPRR